MWDLLQPRQVEDEAEDVCQLPYTVFKNMSSNAIMEKKEFNTLYKKPQEIMHLYVFISSLDGAKLINKDLKYEKGMLEMYFAWIKKKKILS